MRRCSTSRSQCRDLLDRPPATAREPGPGWALLVIDPVNQLRELADLHRRGLLSREEYQEQKSKVLEL
jgi:Short C-terminal domain